MPITSALRRLRQEDWKFEASLGLHIDTLSKKTQTKQIRIEFHSFLFLCLYLYVS
jgi:hypothetical protein